MNSSKPSPGRRVVTWLVLLTLIGGSTFLAAKRFKPNWFDREGSNAAEMAKLADAPLPTTAVTAGDWPQWNGPTRDGRAPAGPLRTDWEKNPQT